MKTKFILIALFKFCFSSPYLFATNIPAGNVYGHWTQVNSPYNVFGNIAVPQDSLLQIDSGVVVQFQGHYQLLILGRIICNGSLGSLILFNAINDWWGIRFDGISRSQDSSLFSYCIIQNGNANGSGNYSYGGAVFVSNFSKIKMEHCTISYNTASRGGAFGIFDSSQIVVEHCEISNNTAGSGGAFYCNNANPKISNNLINNNTATNYYGSAFYCEYASPFITENIISYNVGGTIYCDDNSAANIIGNIITHTSGDGICCINSSGASIVNNIISYTILGIVVIRSSPNIIGNAITHNSGNDYGTGIFAYDHSFPNIINNTIANNTANDRGGGICLQGSTSPIIKNTILWGNSAPNNQGDEIALDQTCHPVFYNCDAQGGAAEFYYFDGPNTFTGTYLNNLDTNPLFINTALNDFSLQPTSPCKNTGDTAGITLPLTDLTGNSRVCNANIEIGAYEICATGIQDFLLNRIKAIVYPNPSKDNITLEISGTDLSTILKLQLTNVLGEITRQVLVYSSQTVIPLDGITSGIYFYQLRNEESVLSAGKIIVE